LDNTGEHLTVAQIDAIARGKSNDFREHLEICADCRNAVEDERDWNAKLRLLGNGEVFERRPTCPGSERIAAAGRDLDAAGSEAILKHAARCDRCGAILREAVFGDVDVNTQLDLLRTASPEWQTSMARRFVNAGKRRPERICAGWSRWLAAVACIATVAGTVLFWQYHRAHDPAKLLAAAYTASRPFEYRMPDAGYSPVRQQRTSSRSAFDRPESLVNAEMEIQRRLQANPRDSALLLLKGRAELIELQYESAVDDLKRASERDPSAEVLVDLGTAIALRESGARKPDYGESIDDLLRALRIDGNNTDALFNLAITYEKVGMLDESIAAWNKFLEIETRQAWLAEARTRLAEVEQRKKARKTALLRASDDPEALIAAARNHEDFEAEYLQNAFWTYWLPDARRDAAADEAARILADSWINRFGDYSLSEAYRQAQSGDDSLLTDAGNVIIENIHGHNDEVLTRGEGLVRKLEAAGQKVAATRTRIELAYSYRRSERHEPCLAITGKLIAELNGTSYWWLAGRTRLEHSICVGRAGGMGQAREERQRTEADLLAHRLAGLALQAQELVTSIDALSGNSAAVWQASPLALAKYWTSAASDAQAQQALYDMAVAAKALGWREAAVAAQAAAVDAAARWGNAEVEALNRVYLASLMREARYQGGAVTELDRANSLFTGLPQGVTVANLILAGQLRKAEAEAAGPDPASAIADLDQLALRPNFSSLEVRMRVRQARGIALSGQGDWRDAEPSFLEAARLASEHVRSFSQPLSRIAAAEMALDSRRNLVQIALLKRGNPAEALEEWESRSPDSDANAETAPAALNPGTDLALTYVVLPAGIAAFAVHNHAVEGSLLPVAPTVLEAEIREFHRMCASPASSLAELRRTGSVLYTQLIGPFDRELRDTGGIWIEPDGFISLVPFGVLIDDTAHYLGERHAVGLLSSLGDLRGKRDSSLSPASRAVIVSAPGAQGEDLPYLPGAVEESDNLASRMPQSTLIDAREAAPEPLARQMASAELMHFAGHGWSNGGNGALILGPDANGGNRYLTATDLARENWKQCQLAVLSACLTAAGEEESGPVNPESLVRALLAAGARRVIASRWSIDSESTPALMKRFYDALFAGNTATVALELASQKIHNTPGWGHPYYWAAFDVYGAP